MPTPPSSRRFVLASLLLLAAFAATNETAADAPPNIVYILADDLGYGDLRCFNPDSKIATPKIDRLAAEGMMFTDAHSGCAVCTPTRYGIMTGRYSWRSSMKYGVLHGYSPPLITADRLTLPAFLKRHGYATAGVGKWHLGLGLQSTDASPAGPTNIDFSKPISGGPTALGFDFYYGIPASLDMPPYLYVENDRVEAAPTEKIPGSEAPAYYRGGAAAPGFRHEDTMPILLKKATAWIDAQAATPDKPFFLYFPLTAPHTPVVPDKAHQGKSAAGIYGDFTEQVDAAVGEIAATLERHGLTGKTLIIFTSDNGFAPMADLKKLEDLGHKPSHHFRGTKSDIFEGGHRIPFIARWPGRVRAASTSDQTICLTDLMATVAEITGEKLPPNAGEDSVSILPALLGTATAPLREATVHQSGNGLYAIRQGAWKLAFCSSSGGWSHPTAEEANAQHLPRVQLYNLEGDLGETTNVAAQHPEVVERLTHLMEKYIADGRSTPGPAQSNEGETSIWGSKPGAN